MDAPDQLLLLEGIWQQLGIVNYHRDVCSHNGAHKTRHADRKKCWRLQHSVNMLGSVHHLPHQSIAVQVKIEPSDGNGRPLLVMT